MARFDLPNLKRRLIQPLLPNKPRGVARVDDRRVRDGIFAGAGNCHRGLPTAITLSPGQASDKAAVANLLAALSRALRGGG